MTTEQKPVSDKVREGWRPFSEAKVGDKVLVYRGHRPEIVEVRESEDGKYAFNSANRGFWGETAYYPTHYQPLPAPLALTTPSKENL